MSKRILRQIRVIAALAPPLLLAACSTYRNVSEVEQDADLPQYAATLADDQHFVASEPVLDWWLQLEDEPLQMLIERALVANRDLRIAAASLREARALLGVERLDWLPTVEAEVAATRQKTPEAQRLPGEPGITEFYSAGFDAFWELDLFGRNYQQVQWAGAELRSREAALRAAELSVAAEVAATYIRLRGGQYQYKVAANSIRLQQETLALITRFGEVGRASDLDVTRATAQLEASRAALPALAADIETQINRLAVLTHRTPEATATVVAQPRPLPDLPVAVAVGDTASLLKRRPDIQQAHARLAAAVAAYNVRVADLYPTITLTGGLGYRASNWDDLGRESAETFVFAPRIRWAAFNLGRVKAQINAADARTDAELAAFERTLARALEETRSSLTNFNHEEERRNHLLAAAKASARAADYARQTYTIGASDFLSVLDAERQELINSAELARSETRLMLNLLAVYKALGGGWQALPGDSRLTYRF